MFIFQTQIHQTTYPNCWRFVKDLHLRLTFARAGEMILCGEPVHPDFIFENWIFYDNFVWSLYCYLYFDKDLLLLVNSTIDKSSVDPKSAS